MTQTPTDILLASERALQDKLTALLASMEKEDAPPAENSARGIMALFKALDDIEARRARLAEKNAAKLNTRYEDMPPPTPEDEARFYAQFKSLVGLVDDIVEDQSAMVLAERVAKGAAR